MLTITCECDGSDELLSFVTERVAQYKRPREVILVDRLPRTLAGKLLRRKLVDLARARP